MKSQDKDWGVVLFLTAGEHLYWLWIFCQGMTPVLCDTHFCLGGTVEVGEEDSAKPSWCKQWRSAACLQATGLHSAGGNERWLFCGTELWLCNEETDWSEVITCTRDQEASNKVPASLIFNQLTGHCFVSAKRTPNFVWPYKIYLLKGITTQCASLQSSHTDITLQWSHTSLISVHMSMWAWRLLGPVKVSNAGTTEGMNDLDQWYLNLWAIELLVDGFSKLA